MAMRWFGRAWERCISGDFGAALVKSVSFMARCHCTPNIQNHNKAASLRALSPYLKEAVVAYETRLAVDPEEKGAVVAGADSHPLGRDNQLQPFASLEPDKLPHGPCRAVHSDSHPHGIVSEMDCAQNIFAYRS
eukprot:scaffold218315_cov17-Prasinocladus_malaysianus.AAC.1